MKLQLLAYRSRIPGPDHPRLDLRRSRGADVDDVEAPTPTLANLVAGAPSHAKVCAFAGLDLPPHELDLLGPFPALGTIGAPARPPVRRRGDQRGGRERRCRRFEHYRRPAR